MFEMYIHVLNFFCGYDLLMALKNILENLFDRFDVFLINRFCKFSKRVRFILNDEMCGRVNLVFLAEWSKAVPVLCDI